MPKVYNIMPPKRKRSSISKVETLEIGEDGNFNPLQSHKKPRKTKKTKKTQGTQLIHWFLTWNNYPENGAELIETALQPLCVRYKFQEETGEKTGTPHLQGNFELKKKMRWTEFGLPKQMTWDPTRSPKHAFTYCEKPETRTGKTYIFGINFPTLPKPIRLIETLRPWQQEVFDICKSECLDDRTIHWYWEPNGNIGKSQFTKWYCYHYKANKLCNAATKDLMYICQNTDFDVCNVIFIDIPKRTGNKCNMEALEEIKNGHICSVKYEGMQNKIFNAPHIIIFANAAPNLEWASADRWHVVRIQPDPQWAMVVYQG